MGIATVLNPFPWRRRRQIGACIQMQGVCHSVSIVGGAESLIPSVRQPSDGQNNDQEALGDGPLS